MQMKTLSKKLNGSRSNSTPKVASGGERNPPLTNSFTHFINNLRPELAHNASLQIITHRMRFNCKQSEHRVCTSETLSYTI